MILAAATGTLLERLTRETNSHALVERGVEAYEQDELAEAIEKFSRANEMAPTPVSAYDLGTSLAANGDVEGAAELLGSSAGSADLSALSFYNLGTLQLENGAYEESIESLKQSLRYDPGSMAAKRNLEIALQRREEEEQRQQQQQSRQQQEQGDSEDERGEGGEPPPGQEAGDEQEPEPGEEEESELPDELESLLRSVEEQEQEELSRMRRARARARGNDW